MLHDVRREKLQVTIGQHSSAGRKAVNQDFHGALIPDDHALDLKGIALAIADGISSSSVSHIAAETAIKSFLTDYYCTSDAWAVKTAGERVIRATNSWLHGLSRRNRLGEDRDRGYLCTFSAMVMKARKAHLFHVGDSRIFRLANGSLEQLTRDHRIVLSSKEDYLGRALGLTEAVEIDYLSVDLQEGDVFVLTTDGVHDYLPLRDLAMLVSGEGALDTGAALAVETALNNGSTDNLTIQIVRIENLPRQDGADIFDRVGSLPPAPLPRVPSQFDGYRIVRQLHASSRSHIFLAMDDETGRKVCLKFPSMDLREDWAYLRRLAMEEWIARRISSPHVLKAAPVQRKRETLYVATEFVEGQTLRQWMTDNPHPDLESSRAILEQIAKGLRAFHRKDMLHQDIRPENIMIDGDGTVKIIDFGSVRVAGVLEARPDLETGDILGTHQYTAPEYFLGYFGTERSDQFSLGVVAYEMFTGRLPYGDRMARATTAKTQYALAYRSATSLTPRVPGWVDHALCRAVRAHPGKRYEALSEFMADLRRPNPNVRHRAFVPLADRNPVRFWQALTVLLALVIFVLLLR